ncbi:hypothetical protein RclHR1_03370008 [Rhizophagus clarus]|uniref:Uncharacterized protein n=1 Tax=Rhizophagus clarus TaxID=94130 RepID=A0A2Z6RQY2_9GLOM|nr:hypothetical protein RclHR1_03370008 [Rhizophagus clarus]GES89484.1 hypothetical protein RCL_jg647.t1 [Rhizophagus clarus]
MDISSSNLYQSTLLQPHIMTDNSQIDIIPKGKGKKKKYKKNTITYDKIDKDFKSLIDSEAEFTQKVSSQPPFLTVNDVVKNLDESSILQLDSHTSKEKQTKVQDVEVIQVIIRYQAPPGCQFI